MIAVKHATIVVPLFATKTAHSHAADVRGGLSRRERILKSPSWDPAGYNKDLRERALSDIAPREWKRGSRRATKKSRTVAAAGCARSDIRYIRPVTLVVFDPGFRVYAATYLPSVIASLSDKCADDPKERSCMRGNLSLTKKQTKTLFRELSVYVCVCVGLNFTFYNTETQSNCNWIVTKIPTCTAFKLHIFLSELKISLTREVDSSRPKNN